MRFYRKHFGKTLDYGLPRKFKNLLAMTNPAQSLHLATLSLRA